MLSATYLGKEKQKIESRSSGREQALLVSATLLQQPHHKGDLPGCLSLEQ